MKLKVFISALPAFAVLGLGLMAAPAAQAQLTMTLTQKDQTGTPGTFHFTGTLTNPTASRISINGDTFNFSTLSPDFTLDDTPFAASTLGAKGSGSDIYTGGFFDVLVDSSAQPGTYTGTFLILGGSDANAQDTVGSGDFSVTVQGAPAVPEASTTVSFGLLLALGLGGVVVSARRRKAASTL